MTIAIPSVQSTDDALKVVLAHVTRLGREEVPLGHARDRVLADAIVAPTDLWPFPRSAMDGFAVRSADLAEAAADHPVTLAIAGTVFAGGTPAGTLVPGTAVRIATGAPIPDGADAVMPIERIEVREETVTISEPVAPGRHVFPAGEDARRGEVILRQGVVLRAGHLGLLASLGIGRIPVVRRANVAVLTVGDELVDPNQPRRPGQVRDSNSTALAAAVEEAGGMPWRLGVARDEVAEVSRRIRRGLEADALIVCAGMSVGERDVVKEALAAAGVRIIFWRVPMKPGAPAAFGLAGTTPVFGLPGTPGAAMVAFEELVRPALRLMMGYGTIRRSVLTGRLTAPLQVRPGRRRYLWAHATVNHGQINVRPLRGQGTATLRSISEANALLVLNPETASLAEGDRVRLQLLDGLEPGEAGPAPILAVVGAKGAGKTTLLERLIPELQRRGLRIAVVKHDVHGFAIDHEGTDSWRFARAGADVAAISGPNRLAIVQRTSGEKSLVELAEQIRGVDLILVEGFSQEPIPKIEVRRRGLGSDRPAPAGPIFATVTEDGKGPAAVGWDQIPALADRIQRELLGKEASGPAAGGESR